MKTKSNFFFLSTTLLLCGLIAFVSCTGLLTPGFYAQETLNWQAQSIGQDIVDLFLIVPVLLVSGIMSFNGKPVAAQVWAGTIIYLIYTFLIFCFAVHFNIMFIGYCLVLGLSFYSLAIFFPLKSADVESKHTPWRKITGIYFNAIGILFYFLWLSEILPATINNSIPETLSDAGLFTNPVHVLDLSIVLPGIFISGILLWRQNATGYMLAPVILTFLILMDCTIGALIVIMSQRGLEADMSIVWTMGALALWSLLLLFKNKN